MLREPCPRPCRRQGTGRPIELRAHEHAANARVALRLRTPEQARRVVARLVIRSIGTARCGARRADDSRSAPGSNRRARPDFAIASSTGIPASAVRATSADDLRHAAHTARGIRDLQHRRTFVPCHRPVVDETMRREVTQWRNTRHRRRGIGSGTGRVVRCCGSSTSWSSSFLSVLPWLWLRWPFRSSAETGVRDSGPVREDASRGQPPKSTRREARVPRQATRALVLVSALEMTSRDFGRLVVYRSRQPM